MSDASLGHIQCLCSGVLSTGRLDRGTSVAWELNDESYVYLYEYYDVNSSLMWDERLDKFQQDTQRDKTQQDEDDRGPLPHVGLVREFQNNNTVV